MAAAQPVSPPRTARRWWLFDARRGPSAALGAVGGLCACLAAAALPAPAVENGPVLCPSRMLTGMPCPGCGLVRGCTYALHGDLARTLHFNPFALVVLALVPVLAAVTVLALVRRRPLPALAEALPARLALPLAVVWVLWGTLRVVLVSTGTWPNIA